MEEKFKCPLCDSPLAQSKYYRVIRIEEGKKKIESELKKELAEASKKKKDLEKEKKEMIRNLEKKYQMDFDKKMKKEMLKTQKEYLAKGKEHEKNRIDRLSKSLGLATERIKILEEQLKKGTTPQMEGLDFEKELVKELKNKFPDDDVQHKGKGGDILHYVYLGSKKLGLIVYECKKTQKFQKSYIKQIKNDVAGRNATYGILVTMVSEKDKPDFWTENGIFIIHPYGAVYLAETLREWIIKLNSLKLDKKELNERAKKLLDYVKSDKFKNCVQDNVHRVRELNELLEKEMSAHKRIWDDRQKHYSKIHNNSESIEKDSSSIMRKG